MRKATILVNIIRERARRGLPVVDIYRTLYQRDLYLLAYSKLYKNEGALTPGTTTETVDGLSLNKIDQLIESIRFERFRWTPVRRTYIPKKNGKTRPLGLPVFTDKLLQEVIRLILEAYYEPRFSDSSHGFRPGRGCHTARAVACNERYPLLSVATGRGQATLVDSVFRARRGWCVHDCYSSYLAHGQGKMALCVAHLVRELQALVEQGRLWAKGMQQLLLDLYEATRAGPLVEAEGWYWQQQYRHWCVQGDLEEGPGLVFYQVTGKLLNKRPKRSKARNLLERLRTHQGAVLARSGGPVCL